MIIERINDEVIIRLPSTIKFGEVQRIIDMILYKEATARSTARQSDIDIIAQNAKKGWWAKNREQFIK